MRISNLCRPAVLALAVTLAGCQSSQIDDLSTASTGDKLPASVAAPPDGSASAPGAVEESARALADAGSANVIASYVPPESGTELTFRNNWSSLPPVITYRVAGTVALGGKTYLKMTSIKGQSETVSAYYDTANFALKGYRDKNDKPILTYKPVEERCLLPARAMGTVGGADDGASASSQATGTPPGWAQRMRRSGHASHAVQTTAHAVRSGDGYGSGSSVNLSESDRS